MRKLTSGFAVEHLNKQGSDYLFSI